jgi:type VI secretion system protein ImpG
VNLFERNTDRIRLSHRDHEHHVVADRTRPLDFEVHSVLSVTGLGASGQRRELQPLFACTDRNAGDSATRCFTVHREPGRVSSARARSGPRSSYLGSETFVALTDGTSGGFSGDLEQLSVRALCTNRDLPLSLTPGLGETDLTTDTGAPVEAIRFVAGPSRPHPAVPSGERSWRLLNHLSLNYLSLTNSGGGTGADALRELLSLHAESAEPGLRRQVEGVLSVESSPVVRRLPLPGPATFARGLRVQLACDETCFEGSGTFLLGSVLERFFAGYASINSFVQTTLSSRERGQIMEWPLRIGDRPSL